MSRPRVRTAAPPARPRRDGARSRPAAPPATRPQLALVALVAAVCVAIGVSYRMFDTDAWEHLAVGRAIWTLGRVPVTEVWTWPNHGAPNVNPSWGFSALIWPLWHAGGVLGLELWRWLTSLVVAGLLWATARRLGARGLAALPVVVLGMLVYRQRVQIRPETIAGVWFALTAWILATRRAGGPDRSWWLVPIVMLWINTHLSYHLAFVLIAIDLIGARGVASWRRLALAAGVAMLAALVNPFGWHALVRPFEFVFGWSREPLFRSIQELGPPVWGQNVANGLPLMLAGWPLLAAWRATRGRRDASEWLTLLVFTPLAITGSRFVATYALAATPYLARDASELLAAAARPLTRLAPWPRAALAAAACVLVCVPDWRSGVTPFGLDFDMSRAPVAACDYIERQDVRGRGLNHFALGGYLLWRFWPERERLPFMDIHPEDAPREVRDLYYRALTEPAGWDSLDGRFHFDYALLSRRYADRPGLLDRLDEHPDWALVFVDDVAALYLRRDGRLAALAARDGYQTLGGSRVTIAERLRRAASDPLLGAQMRAELERQAATTGMNFYGRAMRRALDAATAR